MKIETKSPIKIDRIILLVLIAFFVTSIVFIYSDQRTGFYGASDYALKQVINYVIGFALLIYTSKLDIDQFERLAWPSYIIFFFSLVVLKFSPSAIAPDVLGAKRWFSIPLLGSLQPSEFFKISLIILVAHLISKHNANNMEKTIRTDLLLIGKILLVTVPPSLIVYLQPDTGMVFLYFIAIGSMLFISELNNKLVAILVLVPLVIAGILVYLFFYDQNVIYKDLIPLLSPHQQSRILGWLNPAGNSDQTYQTDQSLLAVGSGEMYGKGIWSSGVYIPEKYTDFIFSSVAEGGGFLTASFIILLFLLLISKIIGTGHRSENLFGSYVCAGFAFSLSVQIFQNIGMVVGIMPVKGISLPFLTYGGSSLFANMIMLGIVLSIRKNFGAYMFGSKGRSLEL